LNYDLPSLPFVYNKSQLPLLTLCSGMSINSVVLDGERLPLPINSLEQTKLEFPSVTMTVSTGVGYPGASSTFHGVGLLRCTNYRLLFVTDPTLPLFDTLMTTWNKIDEGRVVRSWWPWSRPTYETIVHPLEDEESLCGRAKLTLQFNDPDDVEKLAHCVRESRWTGHLDPENTAEPPPPYPPPEYKDL
jgi:hypothetical protein